jgi:hypothetical protein
MAVAEPPALLKQGGSIVMDTCLRILHHWTKSLADSRTYRPVVALVTILLALSPLYLYGLPHFWRTQDEKCYFWLMERIVDFHSLAIEYPDEIYRAFTWDMPKIEGEQAITIKYPIGQPLVLAAAKLVGGYPLVFRIVPLLGLLSVAMLFCLVFSISHNIRLSSLASLILALSPAWLIHSRSIMRDIPSATALLAETLCVYRSMNRNRTGYWLIAGGALAISILIHHPNVLYFVPLFLFLRLNAHYPKQSRDWVVLLLPTILSLCVACMYNHILFGSAFRTGYQAAGEKGFELVAFPQNLINYLVITLIAVPAGGACLVLFTLMRPTVLSSSKSSLMWGFVLTLLVFYSCWNNLSQLTYKPQDLLVFGPRLILPALPFLAFFTACGLEELLNRTMWATVLAVCSLGVLLGLSVFAVTKVDERIRAYSAANTFVQENTDAGSLVLLKPHWFKVIWPHFESRRHLALADGDQVSELVTEVKTQLALGKSGFLIEDQYLRLGVPDQKPTLDYSRLYKSLEEYGLLVKQKARMSKPFDFAIYELRLTSEMAVEPVSGRH